MINNLILTFYKYNLLNTHKRVISILTQMYVLYFQYIYYYVNFFDPLTKTNFQNIFQLQILFIFKYQIFQVLYRFKCLHNIKNIKFSQ